jgi:methylmalonyl-CoA mutase cobalamin-binding subunit
LRPARIGATMRKTEAHMMEIASDKVVQVIFLAREGGRGEDELAAFIDALNDDEKAHLTAIAWVGRGAFEPEDYDTAVYTALAEATVPTAEYLMGMPHLAENLEAGLDALGVDVAGAEEDFL